MAGQRRHVETRTPRPQGRARVTQLGATFVLGPGDRLTYEYIDADSTDHAPVADVLTAVRETGAC